jgi:protein-S-isoprenylcysteine O-methyltransferase Ste14
MPPIIKQLFSFSLPITATIIIPYFVAEERWFLPSLESSVFGIVMLGLGAFFIIVGLSILVMTVRTFILIGKGTLAPWSPTSALIISGMYAYVRNPMISGVLLILLGEASVYRSWTLLIWFLLFFFINHVYFSLSEEPGLLKRFGAAYQEYQRNVPKWIPRISPWKPSGEDKS